MDRSGGFTASGNRTTLSAGFSSLTEFVNVNILVNRPGISARATTEAVGLLPTANEPRDHDNTPAWLLMVP